MILFFFIFKCQCFINSLMHNMLDKRSILKSNPLCITYNTYIWIINFIYSMSIAVGALYIRKYFNENSKSNALEMVNDIR